MTVTTTTTTTTTKSWKGNSDGVFQRQRFPFRPDRSVRVHAVAAILARRGRFLVSGMILPLQTIRFGNE
jgi:hypothetical protein